MNEDEPYEHDEEPYTCMQCLRYINRGNFCSPECQGCYEYENEEDNEL